MAISPAHTLRPPAVAGLFYPEDPAELRASVTAALAEVTAAGAAAPKALIVPHAGYVYSGPIAASAYRRISRLHGRIERVVLLGPSHRIGFRGIALTSHAAYVTPLGTVPIDREACASIAALPGVVELDAAHAQEHSLEVHLPFLQLTLGDFRLLPLVIGDADAASYQPMNINFGLFPPPPEEVKKKQRKEAYTSRAKADLAGWLHTLA